MNYKVAYSIGFHPWEDAEGCPAFSSTLMDLIAAEENGEPGRHGKALDLGTGSAIWAIAMAERGWHVTGVDIIDKALDRGRKRAQAAGVQIDLVHADVTDLRPDVIGSDYRLIVDTGTFHDFEPDQQAAMGRAIDGIATADAVLILTVWPRRHRPLIRGASRDEIETAFPRWTITSVGPSGYRAPRLLDIVLRPDEQFYVLRRR